MLSHVDITNSRQMSLGFVKEKYLHESGRYHELETDESRVLEREMSHVHVTVGFVRERHVHD